MPKLNTIINDESIFSLSGFFALDSSNAFAINFTYFDDGELVYTDEFGVILRTLKPYGYYIKLGYNHSFTKSVSAGLAIRYFKSSTFSSSLVNEYTVNSLAFDLGFNYDKVYKLNSLSFLNTSAGMALTNIGAKVSDSNDNKNFIPSKLSAGLYINPDINVYKNFRLSIELAYQTEKYLVPTSPTYDTNGNIIDGYSSEISSFKALYQSFYDAPGGFDEEINELKHKFGSELRLSFRDYTYFTFRHGRHLEHKTKGNRNYQTFGYGIGAFGFMLDYMRIKDEGDSPLDDNWIITLGFQHNLDNDFFRF